MKCVAEWTVPPQVRNIAIITAGIDAFCRMNGFSERDSRQLQVAVEGVFAYCARSIRERLSTACIRTQLYWRESSIVTVIEYHGEGGELDEMLKPDAGQPVRRTSFEAMGVFIAREILDSLVCKRRFDLAGGNRLNTYTLEYSLAETGKDHKEAQGSSA